MCLNEFCNLSQLFMKNDKITVQVAGILFSQTVEFDRIILNSNKFTVFFLNYKIFIMIYAINFILCVSLIIAILRV